MRELLIDGMGALQGLLGLSDEQFLGAVRALAGLAALGSLGLIAWLAGRMRQPVPARWRPAVYGFGVTVLVSLFYLWLLQPPINLRFAAPLLGAGLVLGLLQGWQTRLYWEGRELIARRTASYLVLWGFAFLATQGLAQLPNAALHAVGILTMTLTLGVAAGATVNLLLRQSLMRARGPR